ncbi:hypothetical protein [Inhella gelatinilytica]|uniref:Uncharacterized protein n=1 Tax=Inhella gelatinilytica TaxID=2795030 RepID=A0A931ND45_9BURK|nr:hypothetical protein [Inhella gelatinilytica]MBH9552214.1 hypothetical protein [Inhella gelatinilytica]
MHTLALSARASGRSLPRQLLIHTLHAASRRLDGLAARLARPLPVEAAPTGALEYRVDPRTGHGVLFEDGLRRFTFLQGLERL